MKQSGTIYNNPLRILGVYVGDSMAKEANNMSRIAKYSEIGKSADFSMRGDGSLPSIERTGETVAEAQRRLTLPKDRLLYALFWYARDDEQPWAAELNKAVDALTEDRAADALTHYITMIRDKSQCQAFCQAATHGLLSPSKDEVFSMLLKALDEKFWVSSLVTRFRPSKGFTSHILRDAWEKMAAQRNEGDPVLHLPYWFYFPGEVRSAVETTSVILWGVRVIYSPASERYRAYMQKAVEKLYEIGKNLDLFFNSKEFSTEVQFNLYLESLDAAHEYIADTVDHWLSRADAMMLQSVRSYQLLYQRERSQTTASLPSRQAKLRRKARWNEVRSVAWVAFIIILYLIVNLNRLN